MKCALCGAEWVPCVQTISQAKCAHEKNSCVLAGLDMLWEPDITAINEAIEQAKKDTRKPEECGYMENDGDRKICSLHMMYVDTKRICPCASWTKA